MPANDHAIEQEYGNIKSVPAGQLRVRIDVDDNQRRQWDCPTQFLYVVHHFIAKVAVVPMHEREGTRHDPGGGRRGSASGLLE